jgi:hypothetical protein
LLPRRNAEDEVKRAMKEPTIEELATEAMQLLSMGVDELYMVLGCQLLASARPTRVAGIMSYLAAARKAREAKNLYATLPSSPSPADWGEGFELICNELMRDGTQYVVEVKEGLRKGVCNEDIVSLADEINASSMQIIVMIIDAMLKLPPQFEGISATLAAIVCKLGLREFCK